MRQRAYVEILSTWEVWRALKRLEVHSAAPRAPQLIGLKPLRLFRAL